MTVVGRQVLGATRANFNLTAPKMFFGAGYTVVIPPNYKLVEYGIAWENGNGTASGTIRPCLYDYGNSSADKPLIPGTTTSIAYNASTLGTGKKWVTVTGLNIDLSAHAGKEVCMGLGGE